MHRLAVKRINGPFLNKTVSVCLLFLLTTASMAAGDQDAYMDALSSEVEDMSVDPATEKTESISENTIIREAEHEETTSTTRQQDFESALFKNYPGTFSYYKKLGVDKRTEVYKAYTNNPDIKSIREIVMEFIVGE